MNEEKRIEQIERYLSGDMAQSQLQTFEQQMESDSELASEVESHRKANQLLLLANQEALRSRLKNIDAELHEQKGTIFRKLMPRLAIAASVLIVVAVGVTMLVQQPGESTQLAQVDKPAHVSYFAPTTVTQLRNRTEIGQSYQVSLAACDDFFVEERYDEARNCYTDLVSVDNMLSERAQWNLMLCHLALDSETYLTQLQAMANDQSHMYHEKAKQLEQELR